MVRSVIPMRINLVHVQRMNANKDMFWKVQNIDIVKVICGGVQVIQFLIVRKKVDVI